MTGFTKPLQAYTVKNMSKLQFPVLASFKLDGIRCVIHNDQPSSRTLKPIPNNFVRDQIWFYPPFDGELLVGDPTDPTAFNKSTSGMMSHGGEPDFTYWVFDFLRGDMLHLPFEERLAEAKRVIDSGHWSRARLVEHVLIHTPEELMAYEAEAVGLGFEGIMVRAPWGSHKNGRSTANQNLLGKVKRFEDTEGIIIGMKELMHNENEQVCNAVGAAERSTALEGQVPGDTLGALRVSHPDYEETFGIGTGFTAEDRLTLWQSRDSLIGATVKFKHQPSGAKDKPRFPVYLGLRKD